MSINFSIKTQYYIQPCLIKNADSNVMNAIVMCWMNCNVKKCWHVMKFKFTIIFKIIFIDLQCFFSKNLLRFHFSQKELPFLHLQIIGIHAGREHWLNLFSLIVAFFSIFVTFVVKILVFITILNPNTTYAFRNFSTSRSIPTCYP